MASKAEMLLYELLPILLATPKPLPESPPALPQKLSTL